MSVVESILKKELRDTSRRQDLDGLRVLGMGVVILVHCARYFDKYGWHVENQTSVPFLTGFVNWAGQWLMPMFMLLAGMGAAYALKSRDWKNYLHERWRRLLVPFIFGVFILSPPQIYLERLSHGQFDGSLWDFLPFYFEGWYGFDGNFAWMGLHLWFLLLLFVFAVLTLPLMWRHRNEGHRSQRAGRAIVLVLFLLILCEVVVNHHPASLGRRNFGGWSPLTYLIVYLTGFGLAVNPEIEDWIRKKWWVGLVVGILGTLYGFQNLGLWYEDYSVPSSFVRALSVWGWLMGIIGLSSRRLGCHNDSLPKLSDAVLPIYILHQPIIVGVGWAMLGCTLDWRLEYGILLSVSSFILAGAYLVIKKLTLIAPLFGFKSSIRATCFNLLGLSI